VPDVSGTPAKADEQMRVHDEQTNRVRLADNLDARSATALNPKEYP
jgi:hypothetical protein